MARTPASLDMRIDGAESFAIDLSDVEVAGRRIAGRIASPPPRRSSALSGQAGRPVLIKSETSQPTGSFKLRGATNAVLALDAGRRARGFITASTGNHGWALAHAASEAGSRAVVCMSALVPANKVEAVRALGAEVRIVGRSQDDAQEEVNRLVRRDGLIVVPPFDHPDVIAGQGTLGIEIALAEPDLDLVLVPLSGGGLAAGVAIAVKALRPAARVVGVSVARGAAMQASLAAGRPIVVEETETLADSLGGGIGLSNRHTFAACRALLDGVVLLSEDEIAAGIRHAHREEGETVEGAGAVGVAAILAGKVEVCGPTVVILSGGNIDPALHRHIVGHGRPGAAEGRAA